MDSRTSYAFQGGQIMTASGSALGLVLNSTSAKSTADRLLSVSHVVDAQLNRIRKVAQSVKTTARLHQEETSVSGHRYKPAMITLTYSPENHWDKKDVTNLIDSCRKYLKRRYQHATFRYTWVAELQKRGMIHYHIILWLPKGCTLPKPDKQGWWKKGQSRIEWVKNAIGYIAKYASKGSEGDTFPKGARISGFGGLNETSRREYRFWRTPLSIRAKINPNTEKLPSTFDLRKITGGYFNKDTGEFIESDYAFVLINGSPHIVKKAHIYA